MQRGCTAPPGDARPPPVLLLSSGGGQRLVLGGDGMYVSLDPAKNFIAAVDEVLIGIPATGESSICLEPAYVFGNRGLTCILPEVLGRNITVSVRVRGYQQPFFRVTLGNTTLSPVDWNIANELDGKQVAADSLIRTRIEQAPPLINSILPFTMPTVGGIVTVGGTSLGMDISPLYLKFGKVSIPSESVEVSGVGHAQRQIRIPASIGAGIRVFPVQAGIQGQTTASTRLVDYERPGMFAVLPSIVLSRA